MSRRPARFTEAEIARAMKVADKRGMTIRIEQDGIRIVPLSEEEKPKLGEKRRIVL
jgi:hypothetical protein